MKGIIIYEKPWWDGNKGVTCCEFINDASYELKNNYGSQEFTICLKGEASELSKAICSQEDTYDFETGALIALMKMCGVEKVKKAAKETFFDVAENSVNEYEEKIHALKEEIKRLKGESDNHWKNYQRNIQKKQDRINELQAQVKASEDDKQKNIEYYEKEIKWLNNVSEGFYNFNSRLIDEIDQKNHEIISLKEENEKLQHRYNDMMFCGGRQNGKQYEALVELFKKIDQKKVDAAYKEAYNKWCNQWSKPPTKREEMWAEIFAIHKKDDVIIKVKKEDINTFLHEIEKRIPEITWSSGVKLFETKYTIGDIYDGLKIRDTVYFRLSKDTKLSYSTDPDVYRYKDLHHLDYLPPMRWDLFKKGRRIIRVTPDKLDEFMTKCSNELGGIMMPNLKRYKEFTHVFVMISDYHYDNKPAIHIMSPAALVHNQHENPKKYSDKKIVDWEDVR